jgi:hypothetical protein
MNAHPTILHAYTKFLAQHAMAFGSTVLGRHHIGYTSCSKSLLWLPRATVIRRTDLLLNDAVMGACSRPEVS